MQKTQTRKTQKKTVKKLTTWGYIWRLMVALAIPLAVGGLSGLIAGDAMTSFGDLEKPLLAPPAWLFPVAWTILYLLMGLASFLIWVKPYNKAFPKGMKKCFAVIYVVQLIFNFLWSIIFFNGDLYWFAFGWLVALWLMILALVVWCGKVRSMGAMWALMPYLLWVTFAGYLNLMIAILN